MQETEAITGSSTVASVPTPKRPRSLLSHLAGIASLLLILILVALIVPLLNVNRFQRRIVTSLSESIGRPIHLDRISLTVLPLPGLTIENLVVAEDPAFGAEPFVRSSTVQARLRLSSLWRRRIEFTRISFKDPSINLVKNGDGKWNVESILLQAARIDAAPTGQPLPSDAPRFPYIEAGGARFNLKLGQEKTPVSLTEADFALWLNSPREWRLRVDGRPLRTDMSPSEIGMVRLEGTLGRALALEEVPVDLRAEWRNAPLGEASRAVLGRDAGLRGTLTLGSTLRGTLGKGALQTTLHLTDLRRADFVPAHPLAIDADCHAEETGFFRAIENLRCSWPPALAAGSKTVALIGSIPDTRRLATASFQAGTPGIPAATVLDWLHIASARVSPALAANGALTGSLTLATGAPWVGKLMLADAAITLPAVAAEPFFTGDVLLRSTSTADRSQFTLAPLSLDLGERDFATLDGRFDGLGYTLRLTGTAPPTKLLALGAALPQLGDGLADALPDEARDHAVRFDLTSTRAWGGAQSWHTSRAAAIAPARHRHRR